MTASRASASRAASHDCLSASASPPAPGRPDLAGSFQAGPSGVATGPQVNLSLPKDLFVMASGVCGVSMEERREVPAWASIRPRPALYPGRPFPPNSYPNP